MVASPSSSARGAGGSDQGDRSRGEGSRAKRRYASRPVGATGVVGAERVVLDRGGGGEESYPTPRVGGKVGVPFEGNVVTRVGEPGGSSRGAVVGGDARQSGRDGATAGSGASRGRRLFFASVGFAVVGESMGQIAERSLTSEHSRLRTAQRRQLIQKSVASFAEQEVIPEEAIVQGVKKEARRAGAIAALAAVGALGSQAISARKKSRNASGAPRDVASSVDDNEACVLGATCAPDWSVDEDEVEDDVGPPSAAPAASDSKAPWWREMDLDSVVHTVVFSSCYGGLFQPHWFNVLNSYEWSDLVFPPKMELQLRALAEQLQQAQIMPVEMPENTMFALRHSQLQLQYVFDFIREAGGYSDPSLVASVSLSLAKPLEAASASLLPLALNQLVVIPLLYWPSFFLFMGLVEGKSLSTMFQTLHQRLPSVMKVNLGFWIPAQGFQFGMVPPQHQALYVAAMGVIWNGVLASVTTPAPAPAIDTSSSSTDAAAREDVEIDVEAR